MSELFVGKKNYSIEEYKMLAEHSVERLEYYNGNIIVVPGGTLNHNLISINIITALNALIREREDLWLFSSDQKIYISHFNAIVYPDAIVISGKPEPSEKDRHALVNPLLIVEVGSPGTENHDRGLKFDMYRTLPSFREYLLVRQETAEVASYFRQGETTWDVQSATGRGSIIELRSLGITLTLEAIYRRVDFGQE